MPTVFEKQLYYYLKGSNYKLGYLLNFGSDKIDIRRRVYEALRNIRDNQRANQRESALKLKWINH